MKVNDSTGAGLSGVGGAQQLTTSTAPLRGRGGAGSQEDQVQLSSLGSALGAQQPNSADQTAKVNQLTAAVGSGAYQVNAYALSGSIIESSIRA